MCLDLRQKVNRLDGWDGKPRTFPVAVECNARPFSILEKYMREHSASGGDGAIACTKWFSRTQEYPESEKVRHELGQQLR